MIPVIALVGRPNVGKSTLFNLLTHTRDALIDNYPGLTRDRQYGHAIIKGHEFIVIDTGGINDSNKEGLEKIILSQSISAITEADIVLLIVDARSGLMPTDYVITNYLRSHNKKTFLVVNKIDGLDPYTSVLDFHQLGLDKIYSISASHGRGISNLFKNALLPYFNLNIIKNEESKFISSVSTTKKNLDLIKPIKIAIVGRPNVGKSTFINRILGKDRIIVYDIPGTTRDSLYIPMKHENREYILIDTAGIRKRGKVINKVEKLSIIKTLQSIKDANVVILIIDACIGISDQDMSLLGFIITSKRPIVIIVNKWDNVSQENKDKVKKNLDFRLSFMNFARIHFISALYIDRDTTDDLFKSVSEAYDCSTKRINTATLTNIMLMAVGEHQPPLVHGRRIKLKYAHAGGYNPLVVIIHGNQLNKLPNSYRRYLMNYFRRSLNVKGSLIYIHFKETNNPYVNKHNLVKNI